MRIPTVIAIVALTFASAASHSSTPDRRAIATTPEHNVADPVSVENRFGDRIEIAQRYSNQCVTPRLSCVLPRSAPVGTACWCATPNGPVNGTIK